MNEKSLVTYHCKLTSLSPVHVGCGERYRKNLDYLVDRKSIHILNKRRLFSLIEKICSESDILELADCLDRRDLGRWLEEKKIDYKKAVATTHPWRDNNFKGEIYSGIKDVWGDPIIPGSSLKGALRTAIIKDLNEKDNSRALNDLLGYVLRRKSFKNNELKFLDQRFVKDLLGKDPNHNLMRTLSIGDFCFRKERLSLAEVAIKTTRKNGRLGEKSFRIYPEVLGIGMTGEGRIAFEKFIFQKDREKGGKLFGFSEELTLEYIRTAANKMSSNVIDSEIRFFRGRDSRIADFYDSLRKELDSIGENQLVTRISWGIGWKSITGELISDLTKELREALRLAPHKYPSEFPKTRKIARIGKDNFPLGWVKLTFRRMEDVRREIESKRKEELAHLLEIEKQEAEEEERRKFLASLPPEERDIETVKDPAVSEQKVVEIYNKIDSFSEPNRIKLAEALKEYWISQGKWKGKLSNKQKIKVAKIKKVLGEF